MKYVILNLIAFSVFLVPVTLNAEETNTPDKHKHFVVRLNPFRMAECAIYRPFASRGFREFTGLSLEVAPVKMFTIEVEPGIGQLRSLDYTISEKGWDLNVIEAPNQWSPTGRLSARIYPFVNDKSKFTFEGFWFGFNVGSGQWKFDSLELRVREHEPDPNTGNEYTNRYYRESTGSISRTSFLGCIGMNFLARNEHWNLGSYVNMGTTRYSIKSVLETVSTSFGPTETFSNSHTTQGRFTLQVGVNIGYVF